LIRAQQQRWRDRQAERLRGLEIDDEFELRRLFDWKTLRTTNTIERLHEELRRRVKTQGSLPSEDAALILLFSLVASGQIKLRRIDGWQKIAAVLSQHTAVAA